MQKSRVLLTLLSFPIVTLLLLIVIFKSQGQKTVASNQTLGAAYAKAQITSIIFSPTPFSPSPTNIPTPTEKPVTPTKSLQKIQNTKSLSPTDIILQEVNSYRSSLGLSRVSPNTETCEFAKIRAQEISSLNTFNHEGFTKRVNEKTLPYPGYSEISENIAYNTDHTDVVNRWIDSPGHAENMRKNTQYVCIGKYGDYYTFEGWQP